MRCFTGRNHCGDWLASEPSYPEGNFEGNQLLGGSIGLSPLCRAQATRFARQNSDRPPPQFPMASSSNGIVHHLSGPLDRASTRNPVHWTADPAVPCWTTRSLLGSRLCRPVGNGLAFTTHCSFDPCPLCNLRAPKTPWSVFQDGQTVALTRGQAWLPSAPGPVWGASGRGGATLGGGCNHRHTPPGPGPEPGGHGDRPVRRRTGFGKRGSHDEGWWVGACALGRRTGRGPQGQKERPGPAQHTLGLPTRKCGGVVTGATAFPHRVRRPLGTVSPLIPAHRGARRHPDGWWVGPSTATGARWWGKATLLAPLAVCVPLSVPTRSSRHWSATTRTLPRVTHSNSFAHTSGEASGPGKRIATLEGGPSRLRDPRPGARAQ